jgi:anaerobic magnesium-protoporphyrin IX monomethyl ester cyclase
MKKKVTLLKVQPKRMNVFSAVAYPGLALPLLGTILKNKGYDVHIYVESLHPLDWERIEASDLIGITINSTEAKECYALAEEIREKKKVPIVMGGYHATYLPEEVLDYCDYAVRGEGEETFAELVDTLLLGDGNGEGVLGISYLREGLVFCNPDRPLLQDIDLIPDQSLVAGYAAYHKRFFQHFFPLGALVASSRGCPHDCVFCSVNGIYRRTVRFRSPEAVVEDIRFQIKLTGRNYIYFVDDNFAVNIDKCKTLLKAIIKANLNIRFSAQVRLEFSQDEEFIRLWKEAGGYMVFIGFESINPQSLVEFKKKQTVKEITDCLERLRDAKINVHGMFVLGGETDTEETVRETARFAIANRIDTVQFLPLTPLPGTQLNQSLASEGRLFLQLNTKTGRYEIDFGVGNSVLFKTRNINPVQLQKELLKAHERFYSYKNIIRSLLGGSSFETFIARCMGHHIVHHARGQIADHISWMRQQGFASD